MDAIKLPTEGAPSEPPGSESLIGIDGNAFAVMGTTIKLLRRAGASSEYVKAYQADATTGNYDHLLAVSMAYLDGTP